MNTLLFPIGLILMVISLIFGILVLTTNKLPRKLIYMICQIILFFGGLTTIIISL